MDGLSLRQNRHYSHESAGRRGHFKHRSHRLPTPEPSRSSYNASDIEQPEESTSVECIDRDMPPHVIRDGSSARKGQANGGDAPSQRHIEQLQPHPKPFHASAAKRPSLPPLRTVLGEDLSSPPRTPILSAPSLQPSPREPSYTTGTFKPLSLYPNKKQRIREVLEPVPPITDPTYLAKPSYSSSIDYSSQFVQSRRYGLTELARSPAEVRGRHEHHNETPFQPGPTRLHDRYAAEPHRYDEQQMSSSISNCTYRDHDPRCPPGPSEYDARRRYTSAGLSSIQTERDIFQSHHRTSNENDPRRPSTRDGGSQHATPMLEGNQRRASFLHRPDSAYPPSTTATTSPMYGQSPQTPYRGPEGSFSAHPPSFFMPASYEYQHNKARKRSNLPKQSTEIMKNWFDQNISNPYPSEEQKATFSNATGISMVQVSNWFINHRRRCPELRDKRERTRGRDDGP